MIMKIQVEELMTQYEDKAPKERKTAEIIEAKLNGKCLLEDSDED